MKDSGLDGNKLAFDLFKHVTTLSTGSILILATLLEKFFRQPSLRWLAITAFISLSASLTLGVGAMYFLSVHSAEALKSSGLATAVCLLCLAGFGIGMFSLMVFSFWNFAWLT